MICMSGPDKLWNYFNQPWLEFTDDPSNKNWVTDGYREFTVTT
jgi:hypothetical protein